MTKKQRAAEIINRLESVYPVAECSLAYEDAWQLLVSVRLAAQCTDIRVNMVTEILFDRYPTVRALAAASVDDIEMIVKPCGLGKTKARDIHLAMNMLLSLHGGLVPDTMEALLAIPGVGRKSANLILGDIFKKPAIVTDTHCIRLCRRFGLTGSDNPSIVEKELRQIVDPEKGNDFCHRLVRHGREVCTARSPKCHSCFLADLCKQGRTEAQPRVPNKPPVTSIGPKKEDDIR
ncbi:MAG: endonuclease III [Oscillospiraceae bacterium]|nr:endonuclease III [Oscillospiraceae bacterium]